MNNIQNFYIYIIESNLINFLIMMWILIIIFKKAKLGALFEKMAQNIIKKIELTKQTTEKILEEYSLIKDDFAKTPKQQEKIIENAKRTGDALKQKNDAEIAVNLEALNKNFEKSIENANNFAREQTTKEIYLGAVDLAKIHVANISDKKMQKYLIDDAIDKLEKAEIWGK